MSTFQIFRQNNTDIYIISHACYMPNPICSPQFEHPDNTCLPCLLSSPFWLPFSRATLEESKRSPAHRVEIFPNNLQVIRTFTVSFASNITITIRCLKRRCLTSSALWDAQKTLTSRVTCFIWYTDVKQRAKTRTTRLSALEISKVYTNTLYR